MAIGVPLSAIRLGRAAESKMKQDAMKGKGAAADNSGARVKFSKSSEVFKQLVNQLPPSQVSFTSYPPPPPSQQNEKKSGSAGSSGGAHMPVKHAGTAAAKPASAYKM